MPKVISLFLCSNSSSGFEYSPSYFDVFAWMSDPSPKLRVPLLSSSSSSPSISVNGPAPTSLLKRMAGNSCWLLPSVFSQPSVPASRPFKYSSSPLSHSLCCGHLVLALFVSFSYCPVPLSWLYVLAFIFYNYFKVSFRVFYNFKVIEVLIPICGGGIDSRLLDCGLTWVTCFYREPVFSWTDCFLWES